MKSWAAPTPEEVAKAVALLSRREQQRYFFDKLQNPEWIAPLRGKDFFKNPPEPERDERKGTIRFVPWPQSQYLARMALLKPSEVCALLLSLPETDNVSVHEDCLAAAAVMPGPEAGALAARETAWIDKQNWLYGLYGGRCAKLIAHLLSVPGQKSAAVALARSLLSLSAEGSGSLLKTVRGKIDEYGYGRVVEDLRDPLADGLRDEAIALFADLLEAAVRLTHEQAPEDYSYMWRPAIEEHDQNELHGDRIPSVLVAALRDIASRIAERHPDRMDEVISSLERRPWRIFRRLAYYIAKSKRYAGPQLKRLLVDRDALDDVAGLREYSDLLVERFGVLEPADRRCILDWIIEGPKKPNREFEDWERWVEIWRLRRLHILRDHLGDRERAEYERLKGKHGEPAIPDFPYKVGAGWVGPTSPSTKAALADKADDELFTYLQSWVPEARDVFGPSASRRGLARDLEALIAESPDRLWHLGERLQLLDPSYVSAMLQGLAAAMDKELRIAWDGPIGLAAWVAQQAHEEEPPTAWDEGERTWNNAKRAAVRLMSAGMRAKEDRIPQTLREKVWQVIEPVTDDPDPTPAHEAEFGGKNMGPTTLALNSNRGEAFNAAMAYGLWVKTDLDRTSAWRGFDSAPELRKVLERHLDVRAEPSIAIRSIYGEWYPWLHLMDETWAVAQRDSIFPNPQSNAVMWEVAWRSYVTHARAFDPMLSVLRKHYENALDRIGVSAYDTDYIGRAEEHLAEHVLVFHLRGLIGAEDRLLRRLYEMATPDLRKHLINFVGRSLWEHSAPEEIRSRMHAFWSSRLKACAPPADATELKAFGAWFAAKHEDPKWALGELVKALAIQPDIDLEFMVLKRLVELAAEMPQLAAEALELLVTGSSELWAVSVENESVAKILTEALAVGGESAIQARRTIEHFGKLGIHSFRPLLHGGAGTV